MKGPLSLHQLKTDFVSHLSLCYFPIKHGNSQGMDNKNLNIALFIFSFLIYLFLLILGVSFVLISVRMAKTVYIYNN